MRPGGPGTLRAPSWVTPVVCTRVLGDPGDEPPTCREKMGRGERGQKREAMTSTPGTERRRGSQWTLTGPALFPTSTACPLFLPSPLTGLPFSVCLSATILPFPLHTNRGQQTAADRAHQPQPQFLSQPLTWTPGRPEASIPAGWVSEALLFHRRLSSPSTPRDVPPHSKHRAAHANLARGCCRPHDTSVVSARVWFLSLSSEGIVPLQVEHPPLEH